MTDVARRSPVLLRVLSCSCNELVIVSPAGAHLVENEIPFPVQGTKPPALTKGKLLRRIDDIEHGRNYHFHTDEEMEHMIARLFGCGCSS